MPDLRIPRKRRNKFSKTLECTLILGIITIGDIIEIEMEECTNG